jgi:hypothetical protein
MSVLAGRFETVFASDAALAAGIETPQGVPKNVARALSVPFALAQYGAIAALGTSAAAQIWRGTRWVLVGAADFKAPNGQSGLGDVRSRSTVVFVFKHPGEIRLEEIADKTVLKRTPDGAAWTWSAPTEGHREPFVFVATQVSGSYLIISDSEEDCRAIASVLLRPDQSTFEPHPFNAGAAAQSKLVGYRRYTHAETDKVAAATTEVSDDAVSLGFVLDEPSATVLFDLSAKTPRTADQLNAERLLPPLLLQNTESGRWAATIQLRNNGETMDQLFVVMSLFGFGVYL